MRDHTKLRAFELADELTILTYDITRNFPREEIYGLTSQMRRAAVSVPTNIAEGYGREYQNDYIRFPRVAQDSLKELETHLLLALWVELITTKAEQPILAQCESTGKLLRALLRALQRHQ